LQIWFAMCPGGEAGALLRTDPVNVRLSLSEHRYNKPLAARESFERSKVR
jgi:hypothetical protein